MRRTGSGSAGSGGGQQIAIGEELGSAQGAAFLLGVPALMMAAALVAAFAPARRGLRIEPTEALRE